MFSICVIMYYVKVYKNIILKNYMFYHCYYCILFLVFNSYLLERSVVSMLKYQMCHHVQANVIHIERIISLTDRKQTPFYIKYCFSFYLNNTLFLTVFGLGFYVSYSHAEQVHKLKSFQTYMSKKKFVLFVIKNKLKKYLFQFFYFLL